MSENNLNQYDGGRGGNNGAPGNGNGGAGGTGGPNKDSRRQNIIMFVIAALLSLLMVSAFVKLITGDSEEEISYNEFIQMLDEKKVESVVIGGDRIYIEPKSEKFPVADSVYVWNEFHGELLYRQNRGRRHVDGTAS